MIRPERQLTLENRRRNRDVTLSIENHFAGTGLDETRRAHQSTGDREGRARLDLEITGQGREIDHLDTQGIIPSGIQDARGGKRELRAPRTRDGQARAVDLQRIDGLRRRCQALGRHARADGDGIRRNGGIDVSARSGVIGRENLYAVDGVILGEIIAADENAGRQTVHQISSGGCRGEDNFIRRAQTGDAAQFQ